MAKAEGKIINAIKKPEPKKKRAPNKKKSPRKKEIEKRPEMVEEKKPAEKSELEEDVLLVSENFSEFFAGQDVKAPVLEKIAESGEINLEQIVFREKNEKETEKGVNYLNTKSDYLSVGEETREPRNGNGMQYSEGTISYETILKSEESQRDRLRNMSLVRPLERDTQKVSEIEKAYQKETGSEKYMTGGDKR